MLTKVILTIVFFFVLFGINVSGQVGINTDNSDPDQSAMLDVKSTDKGILVPRLTSMQRTNTSSPATSLLVFGELFAFL